MLIFSVSFQKLTKMPAGKRDSVIWVDMGCTVITIRLDASRQQAGRQAGQQAPTRQKVLLLFNHIDRFNVASSIIAST